MAGTDVRVELETGGAATAGVDINALGRNIQAELNNFAAALDRPAPEVERVPPPEGAQGMDQALHWLMHFATEPPMLKVYAKSLLFTLNEIAMAARRTARSDDAPNFVVRVKALGKEIALPAATAAIQAVIDEAGGK